MVEQSQSVKTDIISECNLVVLGNVNVGKSTLCGRLFLDLGLVSNRDVDKFKQEAVKNGMESWWLAYLMDQDSTERQKGTTIDVCTTSFNYNNHKYNISDCQGHQRYASLMINHVLTSNFAIVIVSAQKNEFMSGISMNIEQGSEGSTRQHLKILRASNCRKILVAINKMDVETVQWSQSIYEERVAQIKTFVQKIYKNTNIDDILHFVPISGYQGENVINQSRKDNLYSWYQGKSLLETLNSFQSPYPKQMNIDSSNIQELTKQPLRITINDISPDANTLSIAKVEQGYIQAGDIVYIYPNNLKSKVIQIVDMDLQQIEFAQPGQMVQLQFGNIDAKDIGQGSIVSRIDNKPAISSYLEVEMETFALPRGVILSPGSELICHIHALQIPCKITSIKENYNHQQQQVANTYINSLYSTKCVLAFNKFISFEKSDSIVNKPFSTFVLRIDSVTVAHGRVLRYKPAYKV